MLRIILTLLVCGPWVLQAAPETEKEEKLTAEKTGEWVQDLIKNLVSGELTADMVNATIEKLEQHRKSTQSLIENLQKALSEANANYEKENKNYEKAVEALEKATETKAKFTQKIKELAAQRDAAKAQVEDLKTKLSQKEAESAALAVELARKTKELEEAVRHQERLEEELAKARARIAFLEGRESAIKDLLGSEDPILEDSTQPVRKAFSGMKLEE